MVIPHPMPIIHRPNKIHTGELWIPRIFEVEIKKNPAHKKEYPIKITPVFLIFEVTT